METYLIDIVLNRPPTDKEIDLLYEAGQRDSLFGSKTTEATCATEAKSFAAAARQIIEQIESVSDLSVERINLPDPITIDDLATLTNRSPEAIRLLVTGKRGPGKFPKPASQVGKTRLWDLADVASWWEKYRPNDILTQENATTVKAINNYLEAKRSTAKLPKAVAREIERIAA